MTNLKTINNQKLQPLTYISINITIFDNVYHYLLLFLIIRNFIID